MARSARKKTTVGVREIAKAAGVSKSTAGYALQNNPLVSTETREKVVRVARKLGYAPDARVASWMATVRGARSKDLLPLAWLNHNLDPDAFQKYEFLSPYLEGARERARELGYRVEEFWAHHPTVSMDRISRILYQRGIEGVLSALYARHYRLRWNAFAAVRVEGAIFAPRLHSVGTDHYYNFLLALKVARRFGYERVGVCLEEGLDQNTNHALSYAAEHFFRSIPPAERIEPLFYPWVGGPSREALAAVQTVAWIRKNRPQVVIGHSNHLIEWVNAAGLRVPDDTGVIHLAIDDDVKDWAGVHSNRHVIGAASAELAISLIRNRQFGLPTHAMRTSVRGSWSAGWTLPRRK